MRCVLFLFLACNGIVLTAFGDWHAGAARANITPDESVPLAGYGGKTRMSSRVEHPIWLKALAFRDEQANLSVIVTADLVGLSDKMVGKITESAKRKYGLTNDRLILNTSHNHSCPVTEDVLWLYYELNPDEAAARDRYTELVYRRYDEVIGEAIKGLKPAELAFENGLAGFAVNRRRARGPESRKLGSQVDHDVPVLTVRSGGSLGAILFGYSCHTTALGGLSINGDYAGFAQIELEESFPNCIAMFMQNCGGDANPLPRIRGNDAAATALARKYGELLAEAVRQVIQGKMVPITGPLEVSRGETELFLLPGLPRQVIEQRVSSAIGMQKRQYEHFLRQYAETGKLPDRVHYPIQIWSFGSSLKLIALTGETVVDYSLMFKAQYGWNSTWVCGYNNDLLSYVPSLRVLKEGGYEGGEGMLEYGHRAPYTETVESQIRSKVAELMGE